MSQCFGLPSSTSTKNPAMTITIIKAISGMIDKTLSTFALLLLFVLSVTKALKAASLAVLPKNVIIQSMITIMVPATNALLATILNDEVGSKKANRRIEMPQRIYPHEINNFLFPNLSLTAPMNKVVIVAAAALAMVMTGIKA